MNDRVQMCDLPVAERRTEAVAAHLYEVMDEMSVGWHNLREPWREKYREQARRVLAVADEADPIRNYVRDHCRE